MSGGVDGHEAVGLLAHFWLRGITGLERDLFETKDRAFMMFLQAALQRHDDIRIAMEGG